MTEDREKTGKWVWMYSNWFCSECDTVPDEFWDDYFDKPTYEYCPHCGAKMIEEG